MTSSPSIAIVVAPSSPVYPVASFEKRKLLEWADAHDARSREARAGFGAVAVRTGAGAVGALLLLRMLTPRRRVASTSRLRSVGRHLIGAAVFARAAMLAAPEVMRIVRSVRASGVRR